MEENYRFMNVTMRWLTLVSAALLCLFAGVATAQTVLIPTNAAWRYLDDGSDQGTAWREPGFNDTAWAEGPAELGFGDGGAPEFRPEATMVSPGPPPPNRHMTYYFRRRFNVTDAASITNLQARVMRDDGAVVYLNGAEAGRTGMDAGPVNHLTPAAAPGTSGDAEFAYFAMQVDPELLVEGENVLAVEVHQLSGTSSDLSFALELLVITNSAPPPDPPAGNTLIVPTSVANVTAGFGAGTLRAANLRNQQIYGAPNFPPDVAMWITELRFRPDAVFGGPFNTTISSIQINLSTTTRNPDGLSTTYANNIGPDDTVVHSGPLQISSQFTGSAGGPKNFDIAIPLQTAFLYDPAAGNLLLDIRNSSGSSASALSGQGSSTDSASRVSGNLAGVSGGADSGIDALQIVFTLTNPPPRPPPPTLLLRGPYLQRGTQTNILVCWRTSVKTNAIVRFGLAADALIWQAESTLRTNNHYVVLTNLAPGTKYYYGIGAAETNLASGLEYHFFTAPAAPKPTRIWAIGDFGTYPIYGVAAPAVRDGYYNFTGPRHTDVWLMLGDNAYNSGTDDEFQRAVFPIYHEMLRKTVAWSTLGNHETYSADANGHIPYFDIFKAPIAGEAGGVPSGTLKYYSFDYGNIHFVCLDSEFSSHDPNGPMANWLRADLEANTRDWLIAFWHSPPYTWGSHNSDVDSDTGGHLKNMREIFVPILEAHGVDLVLSGHSHIYERSILLDGHYGKSWTLQPAMKKDAGSGRPEDTGPYRKPGGGPEANQGAVYIVAGSAGFATFRSVQDPHPVMSASILQTGSLVVDIDGNRLDGKFVRDTGAVEDSFTIIKGTVPGPLRFASIRVANGRVTATFKTIPGKTYQIERTTGVESPSWTPASGNIVAVEFTTSWSASAAPGADASFYRVVQLD